MNAELSDFQIQPILDIASNRVCGGEVLWRPDGQPLTKDLIDELNEDPILNLSLIHI